jgi:hypothetical protein
MSRQENNIENDFIRKLEELGYQYRPDIKDNTISLRIFEVLKTSGFIICSKILLNSLSVNLT